jgi:hypothetical protein
MYVSNLQTQGVQGFLTEDLPFVSWQAQQHKCIEVNLHEPHLSVVLSFQMQEQNPSAAHKAKMPGMTTAKNAAIMETGPLVDRVYHPKINLTTSPDPFQKFSSAPYIPP